MKKSIPVTLALVTTFGLGFAFSSFIAKISHDQPSQKKVTGIGGIFFKCKDPKWAARLQNNLPEITSRVSFSD